MAGPGLCVAASCLSSSKGFGDGEALGNRVHQLSSSRGSGGTGKRGLGTVHRLLDRAVQRRFPQ